MIGKQIVTIIFFSCFSQGFTQQLSFNVDSIKIYHLPLSMRTSLVLDDYEVRHFKEVINNKSILKTHSISDISELRTFSEVDLIDTFNLTKFNSSVDVRIVIDIYLEKGITLSIIMDDKGNYLIGNEKMQRSRNRKLNDWLRKYIPDLR